ncbi:uncharacterized protein LOC122019848 isoform X2 [Zingiber officinale]|uniref:uncharacterized protein LOC122019848 isoform X2 n=1 Tax=Zingiber officinale TaxID=94328 RepID=UPI001C4BA493|nr:uncharacterized protein LOC122019848 isoform X2 [Zingiber officinale]
MFVAQRSQKPAWTRQWPRSFRCLVPRIILCLLQPRSLYGDYRAKGGQIHYHLYSHKQSILEKKLMRCDRSWQNVYKIIFMRGKNSGINCQEKGKKIGGKDGKCDVRVGSVHCGYVLNGGGLQHSLASLIHFCLSLSLSLSLSLPQQHCTAAFLDHFNGSTFSCCPSELLNFGGVLVSDIS